MHMMMYCLVSEKLESGLLKSFTVAWIYRELPPVHSTETLMDDVWCTLKLCHCKTFGVFHLKHLYFQGQSAGVKCHGHRIKSAHIRLWYKQHFVLTRHKVTFDEICPVGLWKLLSKHIHKFLQKHFNVLTNTHTLTLRMNNTFEEWHHVIYVV